MRTENHREKEQNGVYRGENGYWNEKVTEGLKDRNRNGRICQFYEEAPSSLYESLLKAEKLWPDKVCLVDDDGTPCTFRHLLELVDGFSGFLHSQFQVRPGQHIGVLLYNSMEYCVCMYALNRLRAVMVPLSTKYKEQEIKSLMEKSDLTGIVFHRDFERWFQDNDSYSFKLMLDMERLKKCLEPETGLTEMPKETDEAVLMFTSGTTSRSKGVVLKNYNIMHAILIYQKIFQITQESRTLLPIPAYHITGLAAVLGLFIQTGGCVWLHRYFDAERILEEIKKQKITFFHASPTVFSMLLEKKADYPELKSLKIVACGSGNMPQQKIREMKAWIPSMEFHTVYGLTETSSPAVIFPGDAAEGKHPGAAGCVVPGTEIKICGNDGKIMDQGKSGSILVRGTSVTERYYGQKEDKLTEGWLDTGDIGYFDEEGYLYITDRKKDMINRGGEKVCSYDVENEIYKINGVKEAAVVGIPDDIYGEVPAAMMVLEQNWTLDKQEIRDHLKSRLAKFQIPTVIVYAESLPMTSGMKIDKNKIRELLKEEKNETS